jgi:hypothetical protein
MTVCRYAPCWSGSQIRECVYGHRSLTVVGQPGIDPRRASSKRFARQRRPQAEPNRFFRLATFLSMPVEVSRGAL